MKIQNKKTKISIIIVNYNNAKFLSKSINSALEQSYKNKEIIVVDDNSKDNSITVLNKFKKKVTIIKNKKKTHQGSFDQINSYYKGFKNSHGEFLFFLDSDDYFKKNKVKTVIDEFNRKQSLDLIFDLAIWKYKKKIIRKKFKQKNTLISNWPRFPPQSCISVKKKYADELFKCLKIKKFETLWFDFRIASYTFIKNKNIYILNKYLTFYRQLDNSASKKYKFLSKNWWFRREQAHKFIIYLEKIFKIKRKYTLDRFLTGLINIFYD